MDKLLPIVGIFVATTLLTINLVNSISAQTIGEFALLQLLNSQHFKNQGQCISKFPQVISNAQIAPDLSPQEIKEIAKIICKQRLPT